MARGKRCSQLRWESAGVLLGRGVGTVIWVPANISQKGGEALDGRFNSGGGAHYELFQKVELIFFGYPLSC